jgi:hypothetical protein
MIQEAKKLYRGVLCLHCRQPIPLPSSVARRTASREDASSSVDPDAGQRVFTLRCRVCQEEGLYIESKFIDCEGTPRTRTTRQGKASPLLKDDGELSRAANG